jgi:uncharacterized protein (DUF885 family)
MTDWIAELKQLLADKGAARESERLERLFDLDWRRTLDEFPETSTSVGVPGSDHRWTDFSADAFARRRAQSTLVLQAANSIDAEQLNADEKFDLALFTKQASLRDEGYGYPEELLAIGPVSGPQTTIPAYLGMTRKPQDVAARIDAIPELLAQVTDLLQRGLASDVTAAKVIMPGALTQITAHAVNDAEESPVFAALAPLGDARKELLPQIQNVLPAFEKFRKFLADEYIPGARETIALSDLPNGSEWYEFKARRYTTTSLTPKEIHENGLSEVARIGKEMQAAMREAGFTGSRDEFFDFLRGDPQFFFTNADDLVNTYRAIAKRADPQLAKLFGLLPRNPYGVEPVPAHEEQAMVTAYYRRGAPQIGRPGTFYANTWDLASRPKWEMEALTLHEAVPGHHLQLALAQEMQDVPEFRKHAFFVAFSEGWGLYAESLGSEMGFYTDPYSRFGQLTYEMWRAIRLVVDTGMHAFGWTRQQAIDLFIENAGKATHDITVEVDRYISWPGQALAYKIGELKFKELRARATATLGDRFDIRAFHDQLLCRAALPLDILETAIDEWISSQGA